MGHPTAVVLALLCGLSAAYCLARCLVPRLRGVDGVPDSGVADSGVAPRRVDRHGISVDAWHVVMGTAMVTMLLWPMDRTSTALQAIVFGFAALWCVTHLLIRQRSGAHLRLAVTCVVMSVMLMPAPLASPVGAASSVGHEHLSAVPSMGPVALGTMTGSHSMAAPPIWLAALMLAGVGFVVVAAARAAVIGSERRASARVGLAGEALMAGVMGWMVALAL